MTTVLLLIALVGSVLAVTTRVRTDAGSGRGGRAEEPDAGPGADVRRTRLQRALEGERVAEGGAKPACGESESRVLGSAHVVPAHG